MVDRPVYVDKVIKVDKMYDNMVDVEVPVYVEKEV